MAGAEQALTYNPKLAAQLRALRSREKSTPLSAFAEGFAGEEEESGSVMSPGRSPRAFKAGQMASIINDASGLGKAAILPAALMGKGIGNLPKQMKQAEALRAQGIQKGLKDLDIASEQAASTGLYTDPSGALVGNIPLSPEHININAMRAMKPGERVAIRDTLHPGTPYANEMPDSFLKQTSMEIVDPAMMQPSGARGTAMWMPPLQGRPNTGMGRIQLRRDILDDSADAARTFGHEGTHIAHQAETGLPHGSSPVNMADKLRVYQDTRMTIAHKLAKGEPLSNWQAATYAASDRRSIDALAKRLEKDPRLMTASEWAAKRDPMAEYLRVLGEGQARAAGALSMFDPKLQRAIPATQDPFMTSMQSIGTRLPHVPSYMKNDPIERLLDQNSWTKETDWNEFLKRFVK